MENRRQKEALLKYFQIGPTFFILKKKDFFVIFMEVLEV